jgi:hypothetical protein
MDKIQPLRLTLRPDVGAPDGSGRATIVAIVVRRHAAQAPSAIGAGGTVS